MDIDVDQKLLGMLDISALRDRILTLDSSVWNEHQQRQLNYDVHQDTESVVLIFCDESWPDGTIHKEAGWGHLADVAEPLMQQIIHDFYQPGGKIIRAMAAKLKPKGKIRPHHDSLRSFHMGHRIHIPITSNAAVRFTVNGKPCHLEEGLAFEINNQKKHSVMNMGNEDRISFIFDYVPAEQLAS